MVARKLEDVEVENHTARRVLATYLSTQLQSGLATLKAAIATRDSGLVHGAAKKYLTLSEIAKDFYSHDNLLVGKSSRSSHSWGTLLSVIQGYPNVVCSRVRRLVRVNGDEALQKVVICEILNDFNSSEKIFVDFRQRGDDLVMRCQNGQALPRQLSIAGQTNALLMAARGPSIDSIKGYLINQNCARANIRVRAIGSRLYLHFRVARQLKMPLGD